jgi:hypothetical protein
VSLRGDIRECQEYAEACTHIAACAADAKTRDDILRLKRSWLRLPQRRSPPDGSVCRH